MAQGLVIENFKQKSIHEAHAEAERELGVRLRCYPKWIEDGKRTPFEANEQYHRLHRACEALQKLSEACQDSGALGMLQKLGVLTEVDE